MRRAKKRNGAPKNQPRQVKLSLEQFEQRSSPINLFGLVQDPWLGSFLPAY